jgi:hypothetical protein
MRGFSCSGVRKERLRCWLAGYAAAGREGVAVGRLRCVYVRSSAELSIP